MRTPLAAFLLGSSTVAQAQYAWHDVSSSTRPFARQRHELVYDAARQQAIQFRGFNGGYLGDTCACDASGWHSLHPAHNPPARADFALACDPRRERVVLIGGTRGTPLDDTWEWDGTDWTQVATGVFGLEPDGPACFDPGLGGVLFARNSVNMLSDGASWRT